MSRAGLVFVAGGPVAAGDVGAWLITVAVWQVLFFIALRDWPFNELGRRR